MKGTTARRIYWLIPFVIWAGLVFYFSSQPYKEQNIQPFLQHNVSEEKAKELLPNVEVHYRDSVIVAKKEPYRFIEFFFRKGSHLFVYFMLAVLGFVALYPFKQYLPVKISVILCLLAGIAILDEWNQGRSSARTPAIQDVAIDLAGGVIGLVSAVVWYAARKHNVNRSAGKGRGIR